MPKKKAPKLKPKKVKARVELLKALPYRGIMVYLRMIDKEIFEYIIPFKGQIYTDYLIMKPGKGKKKLSKGEINQSAALIFVGATTTADFLLGTKLDKKSKELVETFEKGRKIVEKNN